MSLLCKLRGIMAPQSITLVLTQWVPHQPAVYMQYFKDKKWIVELVDGHVCIYFVMFIM